VAAVAESAVPSLAVVVAAEPAAAPRAVAAVEAAEPAEPAAASRAAAAARVVEPAVAVPVAGAAGAQPLAVRHQAGRRAAGLARWAEAPPAKRLGI
jgi:hypothetical protein